MQCNATALIPLSEFSDAVIMKKYGVTIDAETLDTVATLSRQKKVNAQFNDSFIIRWFL